MEQTVLKNILAQLKTIEEFKDSQLDDLTEIPSRGLAHDHIKIGDSGWILRIPRGNQLAMEDKEYIRLQQTIFNAAAASKRTPEILGIILPSDELPHGALIVEYIKGRDIQSEQDLNAVAECLGQIHRLSVPAFKTCIQKSDSPLAGQLFLLDEVFKGSFDQKQLSTETKALLKQEYKEIKAALKELKNENLPFSLIGGDSHLGNYLIGDDGRAYMVDLEFACYDLGLIDLADASLGITSELDPAIGVKPSEKTVTEFYQAWKQAVGPQKANALKPAIEVTERLVQLRTLAWLCYWQAEGREKEKNKVSPESLKNWDRMANEYLDAKNLKTLLAKTKSKSAPTAANNNIKPSFKNAFKPK